MGAMQCVRGRWCKRWIIDWGVVGDDDLSAAGLGSSLVLFSFFVVFPTSPLPNAAKASDTEIVDRSFTVGGGAASEALVAFSATGAAEMLGFWVLLLIATTVRSSLFLAG